MFSPRHRSTSSTGTTGTTGSVGSVGSVGIAVVAMLVSVALALTGQPVNAAPSAQRSGGTVAHTDQGRMTSQIVGRTTEGQRVTGKFTPLHVARRHGDLLVKGVVQGVIHEASGSTSTFTAIRSLPVRSVNGAHLSRAAAERAVSARSSCDILHLVLGPLDLDLLGLQVHLTRVVLDIVAVTGAGNLLGNLLCAVAGLLDGTPLAGLLGQLAGLLNQILGTLNLGG